MIQSVTNELHFLEILSNINRQEQSDHMETPGILSNQYSLWPKWTQFNEYPVAWLAMI